MDPNIKTKVIDRKPYVYGRRPRHAHNIIRPQNFCGRIKTVMAKAYQMHFTSSAAFSCGINPRANSVSIGDRLKWFVRQV